MRITSTISQASEDIPVVLTILDGKSKFLPRPGTHKDMQRLVRAHYDVPDGAALQFDVSSWDVCAGQNVEITEPAFALLVPLLDRISVSVRPAGELDRVIPTPAATPTLAVDEENVAESCSDPDNTPVKSESESSEAEATSSDEEEYEQDAATRGKARVKVEDVPPSPTPMPNKRVKEQATRTLAATFSDEQEEEADTTRVKVEQVSSPTPLPKRRVKEAIGRTPAKGRAGTSRQQTTETVSIESSQASQASDTDERFRIVVSCAKPRREADFHIRGRYTVQKVLVGVCNNFQIHPDRAKLMLCVEMDSEEEEGERESMQFECARSETMTQSGVRPGSRLVVLHKEPDEDDSD